MPDLPVKIGGEGSWFSSSAYRIPVVTIRLKTDRIPLGNLANKVGAAKGSDWEIAASSALSEAGYTVMVGDDVHLASHVIAGNFMSIGGSVDTFRGYCSLYGFKMEEVDSLLRESDRLLKGYLAGDQAAAGPLLESLFMRWKLYYSPAATQHKWPVIQILIEFWKRNPDVFDRWLRWYHSTKYNPGGAPDYFAWSRDSNDWSWVEVKGKKDNPHEGQWWWYEQFIANVAPNVVIMKVQPRGYDGINQLCPHCGASISVEASVCYSCRGRVSLSSSIPDSRQAKRPHRGKMAKR